MKKKIEEALSAEYKGLGLSEKTIGRLADYLLGSIEKEEDIATAVKGDAVKLLATSIQGEIAGLQRAKESAESALADYKAKHPESDPKPKKEGQEGGEEGGKDYKELLGKLTALEARLEEQDKKAKQKAALSAAIASAKKAGCTDERVLKLTEKLFVLKDDESDEDAGKRFESEYNNNAQEYFGGKAAPYIGVGVTAPAEISAADRAKQAREDAKRVRVG